MLIHSAMPWLKKQRLAFLSLLLVAGQGFVGNQGGKADAYVEQLTPTAEEIVQRYVKARGGMQKIMAIRTLILRGEGSEGDAPMRPGRVMTRARPYYLLVADPAKKATADFAEGNDGSHWEFYRDPGLIIRTTGAPANAIRHTAYFDDALVMSAREPGWKVNLMGKEMVAGRETCKLHVIYPDGFEVDFFVDSQNWLVVANRMAAPTHAFGEAVKAETRWLEWREVNGVLFPTMMQGVEIATNKILDRGRWTSIEANVELPPDTFSPPEFQQTPLTRMLNAVYAARTIPTDALGWYTDFRNNPANAGVDTQPGMAAVGYQILKTGAVETAILLLEANVKDNPKSAQAHFGLGRAYRTAGRETEAVAMFRKALAIDPTYKRAADALNQSTKGTRP
jgi:tetratricopeptide (TPR) repeat protein